VEWREDGIKCYNAANLRITWSDSSELISSMWHSGHPACPQPEAESLKSTFRDASRYDHTHRHHETLYTMHVNYRESPLANSSINTDSILLDQLGHTRAIGRYASHGYPHELYLTVTGKKIAIKDNISYTLAPTSCSSQILQGSLALLWSAHEP
jgi:hypothetical protein